MIDIVEKVNYLKEQAKENLLKDGKVLPVVFGILPSGEAIGVPLTFENAEEKYEQFSSLQKFFKEKGVTACTTIIESWLVLGKEEKTLKVPPSEHPERKECIYVNGKMPGRTYTIVIPFERKGKDVQFKEEIVFDSATGSKLKDNLMGELFFDFH